MTDNSLLDIPSHLQTYRLYLRPYRTGDEEWFYEMSLKNRSHLAKFESENIIMEVQTREDAGLIVHDLAARWAARKSFFLGAFTRHSNEFVAQIYIGPTNWDLPEFEVGYFADIGIRARATSLRQLERPFN